MRSRFPSTLLVSICLVAVTGVSAFGQGRPPGAGPGGPPPGAPPAGGPGPGGLGGPGGALPLGSHAGAAGAAKHSSLQFGPAGRWCDNKAVVQTVGIRLEQQKKMDAVFNANKPAILASYKVFLSEQAKLEAINKNPQVDKVQLFAAIDAVSHARASLQKATSQMLLEIRQQMDPAQIAKLEKLQ